VIGGASQEQLTRSMSRVVEDLRGVVLIPEIGHWVQQEAPEEVSQAMLDFLNEVQLTP
jgi:pimeloyl-ACP methyl ester carboxylesterase